MPELNAEEREALDELAEALSCSQCGRSFSHRACGPTHAIIAANPRQHRLIAPLIAAAQREAAQAVLDAVEAVEPGRRFHTAGQVSRYHLLVAARATAARYGAGTAAGGDGR